MVALEIDAAIELGERLHKHTQTLRKFMERPIYKPIGGSVVIPTGFTAPVMCRLQGSPARGRMWNILKVGIFGADPHTAITNVSVDVYCGYIAPTTTSALASVGAFTEVILSGQAVPSITQFSKEVEWCSSGEEVYALLYGSGLVAAQQYEVVARVGEYRVEIAEAVTA